MPDDLAGVLTLELALYNVTQMYHCTRHEAIIELGYGKRVFDPDPWAVKIHNEFDVVWNKLKASRKT